VGADRFDVRCARCRELGLVGVVNGLDLCVTCLAADVPERTDPERRKAWARTIAAGSRPIVNWSRSGGQLEFREDTTAAGEVHMSATVITASEAGSVQRTSGS
jgi:hypothetical protein